MYEATPSHWFTDKGKKIPNTVTFKAKTLTELGFRKMHHHHRYEYGDLSDKENKVTILYSPAIEVLKYGKHYGWYYFWNCNINRHWPQDQYKIATDQEYKNKILSTPKYWAGEEPKEETESE